MSDFNVEVNEALVAGQNLLATLRGVQKDLESAKNWGIFDMFTDSFLVTFIKQNKVKDANRKIDMIKYQVSAFRNELRDVDYRLEDLIDMSNMVIFGDYFFDSFFMDLFVQSKISDSLNRVSLLIRDVENIITNLRRL